MQIYQSWTSRHTMLDVTLLWQYNSLCLEQVRIFWRAMLRNLTTSIYCTCRTFGFTTHWIFRWIFWLLTVLGIHIMMCNLYHPNSNRGLKHCKKCPHCPDHVSWRLAGEIYFREMGSRSYLAPLNLTNLEIFHWPSTPSCLNVSAVHLLSKAGGTFWKPFLCFV